VANNPDFSINSPSMVSPTNPGYFFINL